MFTPAKILHVIRRQTQKKSGGAKTKTTRS